MIKIELDSSVKTLNFGTQKETDAIHNALVNKGILTVEELCRITKTQYSKSFDMDVESITFHLSKVGLRLGMSDKDFVQFLEDRDKLLSKNEESSATDISEDDDEDFHEGLVMNDYETGEQLVFTNLMGLYQYFDEYVSKLRKENSDMEDALEEIKTRMIEANEKATELDKAVTLMSDKVKTFIEQTKKENIREQRIFEIAKEEFLRSRSLFKSRNSRLKQAFLNATLLVDGQSYVLESLEKELNKSNK